MTSKRLDRTRLSQEQVEKILVRAKSSFPISKEEVISLMQYCYELGSSSDLLQTQYKPSNQTTQIRENPK